MSNVNIEREIDRSKMEVSDEIAIHISDMNICHFRSLKK